MKKILLVALGLLALSGCKIETDNDYDIDATRAQSFKECEEYGGVSNTISLNWSVDKRPWTVSCINKSTGNVFNVYIKGVLK